jgi:hypothetical protein
MCTTATKDHQSNNNGNKLGKHSLTISFKCQKENITRGFTISHNVHTSQQDSYIISYTWMSRSPSRENWEYWSIAASPGPKNK